MSLSAVQYLGGFIQRLVYLFADQENGTRGFLTLLSSTTRQGNGTRRAFSRSPALGSLGTARWDHHGDRRPHTFIPRDVSPWSNAAPSSLSRKPHTQLSYTYTRPFVPPWPRRSSDWARSHLPPKIAEGADADFRATGRAKASGNDPAFSLFAPSDFQRTS